MQIAIQCISDFYSCLFNKLLPLRALQSKTKMKTSFRRYDSKLYIAHYVALKLLVRLPGAVLMVFNHSSCAYLVYQLSQYSIFSNPIFVLCYITFGFTSRKHHVFSLLRVLCLDDDTSIRTCFGTLRELHVTQWRLILVECSLPDESQVYYRWGLSLVYNRRFCCDCLCICPLSFVHLLIS